MTLAECLSTLDGKSRLEPADALALRQTIYGADIVVTQAEVDALFRLNADAGQISAEWRELFIEAMTDFVVRQQHPEGYIDDAKADWLIAAVSAYKRVREDELEMLVHVIETAEASPVRLSDFVLRLAKHYALFEIERRGHLALDAVERLRRVIFAVGGEDNIQVSRHQAEALFDVNDALRGKTADPAWRDLFVHAVANSVLFRTTWAPDATTELQDEAWLADDHMHPLRRLAAEMRDPSGFPAGMREGFREVLQGDFANHDAEQHNAMHDAVEAQAARVTGEEAHWLLGRIRRVGGLDANEQALLAYLKANATVIDPALQGLVTDVAAA